MSDQPSQAFLDSEIGREIEDLVMHSHIAGTERRIFERHDKSLAAIERLLIAERHRVAEECIGFVVLNDYIPNGVCRRTTTLIRASFPAPKETTDG